MSQLKDLLDREARRIGADPDALDSILRVRDRRQRHRRVGAAGLALVIVAVAAAWLAGVVRMEGSLPADPQPGPVSPRNGEIAVRAGIGDGSGAIIQVDPETGEEHVLPVVASQEDLAFQGLDRRGELDVWWSPDGTTLAYGWDEDGWRSAIEGDLWVMDLASGTSHVIVPSCDCRELAWSPDGGAIAIVRGSDLEVMKPDGSERIAIAPLDPPWNHDLAWTPDGERILFAVEADPNLRQQRLYAIDRDGSNLTLLHEYEYTSRYIGNPVAWSPDGTKVASFTWNSLGGMWAVGVVVSDIDGSDRRVVLEEAGECCHSDVYWYPFLAWSPDGTQLALTIDGPGDQPQGLYVMNADGTDLRLIREDVMGRPAWRAASDVTVRSATPTAVPPILEGVAVDVSAPDLAPQQTPQEIARVALDAIQQHERRAGKSLAPRRIVSITLVAPGVIFDSRSDEHQWWYVEVEGTIVMWGGSGVSAPFGYRRGFFTINDRTGKVESEGAYGLRCLVSSHNGQLPPGFEDTPDC